MDTSERICIVGSGQSLSDVVRGLQGDKGLVIIFEEVFNPVRDVSAELFSGIYEMFNEALAITSPTPTKWYNPTNSHNYRKMHRVTPRRVVKRRDRQSRGCVALLKVECDDEEEEVS